MKLLTESTHNPKTAKSIKAGYETGILHLAPANMSSYNVCQFSTSGCRKACLNSAGRAGIVRRGEKTNAIQQARIARTVLFFQNQEQFGELLYRDIKTVVTKAAKKKLTPAIRLNGTSDLPWESITFDIACSGKTILDIFPNVQFYDYTKNASRLYKMDRDNYHLTLSRYETTQGDNWRDCKEWLRNGRNVAVVFRKTLPPFFRGHDVIDGDVHDVRMLDRQGVVVGLLAKGKAKKDTTGFVVDGMVS